ncbi:hypothetical protein BH11BAC3_BH11BAC3_47090 [soil metagenome]
MNFKQKIENLTSKDGSNWLKKAEARNNNRWLKVYSSEIARRVIFLLKERSMSQLDLANALKVKPQRVNKIVKGKENLTLETIYKLSDALNFQLIKFPKYGWHYSEKSNVNYIDFPITNNEYNIKEIDSIVTVGNTDLLWTINKGYDHKGWNTELPFIGDAEIVN